MNAERAGPSAPPSYTESWERYGDEAAPAVPIAVPAMPKVANPDACPEQNLGRGSPAEFRVCPIGKAT